MGQVHIHEMAGSAPYTATHSRDEPASCGLFKKAITMTYHHLLVKKEGITTEEMLIFKDLSEQELRTPFLVRFLNEAHNAGEPDGIHAAPIRARVIRTERPHEEEVSRYIRHWGEEAEKFMMQSSQHIDTRHGDDAIAGAGQDVTVKFLAGVSAHSGGHNRP